MCGTDAYRANESGVCVEICTVMQSFIPSLRQAGGTSGPRERGSACACVCATRTMCRALQGSARMRLGTGNRCAGRDYIVTFCRRQNERLHGVSAEGHSHDERGRA